jgi:hypothetical protein
MDKGHRHTYTHTKKYIYCMFKWTLNKTKVILANRRFKVSVLVHLYAVLPTAKFGFVHRTTVILVPTSTDKRRLPHYETRTDEARFLTKLVSQLPHCRCRASFCDNLTARLIFLKARCYVLTTRQENYLGFAEWCLRPRYPQPTICYNYVDLCFDVFANRKHDSRG